MDCKGATQLVVAISKKRKRTSDAPEVFDDDEDTNVSSPVCIDAFDGSSVSIDGDIFKFIIIESTTPIQGSLGSPEI